MKNHNSDIEESASGRDGKIYGIYHLNLPVAVNYQNDDLKRCHYLCREYPSYQENRQQLNTVKDKILLKNL